MIKVEGMNTEFKERLRAVGQTLSLRSVVRPSPYIYNIIINMNKKGGDAYRKDMNMELGFKDYVLATLIAGYLAMGLMKLRIFFVRRMGEVVLRKTIYAYETTKVCTIDEKRKIFIFDVFSHLLNVRLRDKFWISKEEMYENARQIVADVVEGELSQTIIRRGEKIQ